MGKNSAFKIMKKLKLSRTIFNCGIKNYYNDFDNNFSLAVFSSWKKIYVICKNNIFAN